MIAKSQSLSCQRLSRLTQPIEGSIEKGFPLGNYSKHLPNSFRAESGGVK